MAGDTEDEIIYGNNHLDNTCNGQEETCGFQGKHIRIDYICIVKIEISVKEVCQYDKSGNRRYVPYIDFQRIRRSRNTQSDKQYKIKQRNCKCQEPENR